MQRYHQESDRLSQLSQPTKRSKKYMQNQSLMMMSRLYDNHFDRDIHEKPWISLGIFRHDRMIKYEHSDAGLSYTNVKIKKLRTFQELWEKNDEIHNKSEQHQGFREFREFKDISEEDVIVTIEYCTNCHEHMGSTKHDEQRYLSYAQALKNEILARFPIAKVILKPLIYDHLDHSIDTMFLQRRLGCFEVQVMSKQKGQIKQAVIGSKLATKAWPQTSVIINKLPQFFKKVSFNIDLKFADSEQRLKNIDVKIQPFRPIQQRSQSAMFTTMDTRTARSNKMLRPSSGVSRPKSAYSNMSANSIKEPKEETYRIERTNLEGRITLKNVSLDVYEVIVEETNDFLCKTHLIDLFKLCANDLPLDQVIELQKQTHSCIVVQVHSEMASVTECRVEIVPIKGGKDALLKESPSGSGKYEIVVEPDQFQVFVKKQGYHVYTGRIQTSAGVCEFKYELQKAKNPEDGYDPVQDALDKKHAIKPSSDLRVRKPKFLQPPSGEQQKINLIQFKFIDLVKKEPVPDVYIKVFDEVNNKLYSYRSNSEGVCKALLQHKITKGKIVIQHNEYYHENRDINEQHQLSTTSMNVYHIIHKPQQSQLVVLLVNKPKEQFINFYIIQENKSVIQEDQDIQQYSNPEDGIQCISFDNLQNKRDILQLVGCLPKLKIDTVLEMYVLTPNKIQQYDLPQLPTEPGLLSPYFWVLGSLKEPYEAFDVVNQIIFSNQLKTYPNLTKTNTDVQVVQSAFQSPNLIVAANQNNSVSVWNLDTYLVDNTIPGVLADAANQIVIWDDDNVMISDASGQITWLRKDEETQLFACLTQLQIGKKVTCMCKVGAEGLALGGIEGILILVKVDLRQLQLVVDALIDTKTDPDPADPIYKIVSVTNDQIAFLQDKCICIYKVEKALDKPLGGTLIKQVPLKGYQSKDPVLQILSLEQRYLIFGGMDGVLHTLSIDSHERGPNISLHSDAAVNSVLQNEDGILIMQGSHVTFVHMPESVNELKINNQKYFCSPVPLYLGECVSYEKRLLTYTQQGKMVVWSLQDRVFPNVSQFLLDSEFPRKLRPVDRSYLLIEAKVPKENFSVYLIKENGDIVKDSNTIVKFEREESYFYLEINQSKQEGLWRLGAHLQNTELIRQRQPKIYFIQPSGFQVLQFPQQIPMSRKQAYHWLIGTLIPRVETLKTTSLYTDSQIVGRFPSLEMGKHEGKINQIVSLSKEEFVTAGEDRQVIIWNALTFGIVKVLYHEAEVLSIFIHNGMLLAGNKDGMVMGWKQHDGIWQQDLKFKYHEKGVFSIAYVDGSIVTSSEDRKMHLVNFVSGVLEHVEPVDRTFVISLVSYSKDSFAAGFPDGRVKTYKREKTGPKIVVKTLRTVVTVKVQHLSMITNNQLFIGGMDKISDILNVEQGTKQKTLKDGHTGSILCSLVYCKHLITGGSDGRLSVWNAEKGLLVKTFELTKEEIRGVLIVGKLLITASSNGVLRIWQEICPFIEQIPPEEEPEQPQQPYTSTPQIRDRRDQQSAIEFRNPQSYKYYYLTQDLNSMLQRHIKIPMNNFCKNVSKLRDPPNSREFKKTIPSTMIQDKERLYEELSKTKQMCNTLKLDNYQLRVQLKSMESSILKVNDPPEIQQSTMLMQLKKQNKELRQDLEEFKDEMIRVKRSAKLTKIQELEAELKNYQDETSRLKSLLHQQILKTSNPTKTEQNIEDNIIQLQEQLAKCTQQRNARTRKLQKAEEEINKLEFLNQELDQNYQKSIKEKTQLKKQLQSLEEQFNKAQLNDPLFRRGQDVTQMKLELEKKVVENNQLKNEIMIKDRRMHELEKSLKEVTNTFQDKLNTVTKEKESFKERYEKQKQELIELQDKYQQLFFNSNRNLQSQRREAVLTIQSQEEGSNAKKSQEILPPPEIEKQSFRRKPQRKLSSIRQDDIEELLTQLRYKLRSLNIRSAELEIYLFRSKESNETTLGEMIQILQNKPFSLNQNESVLISRYLIEPYGEKEITYNINLSKDNESIMQTLIRAVGKYNILVGEDRTAMHEAIRTILNQKKEELIAFLKPKKQQGNSQQSISPQLPGSLVSRQQFKTALLQTSLDEEQTDVLMQTLYELSQDFNFIDLDLVFSTWPATGQIKISRPQVEQFRPDGELPDIVRECIDTLLEYADKNGLSILDVRKQIDTDNSGHVERTELKQFLAKCDIQLSDDQFDIVLDHFDIEGDGRISTNDIGTVLNTAYNKRMQAMKQQRSAKKTSKQILNLVASHFLSFMQSNKMDLFQIFMTIDQDGSGSVSKDEFKQMLRTRIVIPLDQEEYAEFFKLIDSSNDGQIHFNEFQQQLIPEIEKISNKPYHEILNDQVNKKFA